MFIIVPLSVIAAALLALGFIVLRKWPYLRKLEPEAHPLGRSFLHDLAPEAAERIGAAPFRHLWHQVLHGAERAVVAVRSAFAAIERASDRMMRSIRSTRKGATPSAAAPSAGETAPEPVRPPVPTAETEEERLRRLKGREQELIVAIAQDPKDADQYRELSDIYVKLENIADAVEALKAAVKLEPENERLTERLERLTERLERERKRKEEAAAQEENGAAPGESGN